MNKEVINTQIAAIETVGSECQKIIARHDELLFKIKALSVTIWSASAGWAVVRDARDVLVIGFIAVIGLWFVAATFRGAQKRYIRRSDAVFLFLTDREKLDKLMSTGQLPDS